MKIFKSAIDRLLGYVVISTTAIVIFCSISFAGSNAFTIRFYPSNAFMNSLSTDEVLRYFGGKGYWADEKEFSFLFRERAIRFNWYNDPPIKWIKKTGNPLGAVCSGKCDGSGNTTALVVLKDDFRVDLEGDFSFDSGTYSFGVDFTNGDIVMFIDKTKVIEIEKHDNQTWNKSQPFYVAAGTHHVRIVYYHKEGPAYLRFYYRR